MSPALRRTLLWFVAGALGGTLLDRIHTFYGVIEYRRPFAFGEAWYVPLLMGALAAGALWLHEGLAERLEERPERSQQTPLRAFVWFVLVYLGSGLYQAYPAALAIAFVSSFVARVLLLPPSRALWFFAGGLAVAGAVLEHLASQAGLLTFRNPDVWGLPLWLPGLYLHGALLVRSLAPSGSAKVRPQAW